MSNWAPAPLPRQCLTRPRARGLHLLGGAGPGPAPQPRRLLHLGLPGARSGPGARADHARPGRPAAAGEPGLVVVATAQDADEDEPALCELDGRVREDRVRGVGRDVVPVFATIAVLE